MTDASDSLLSADADTVRRFIETVHVMAATALEGAARPSCLQLVRIHPTGDVMSFQFNLEDVEPMIAQALADARAGFNVYVEGRTVEPRPRGSKERGGKDQTRAVFALVIDDRDKGKAARPGPQPSLIVETSPGNRHLWYFLKRAVTGEQAVPVGQAMNAASGADGDTGVPTQPYRVAGTPNYPNKVKAARGRIPARTRILEAGGPTYSLEALQQAFPAIRRPSEQPRQQSAQKGSHGWREIEDLAAVPVEQMKERDRSRHFYKCVGRAKDRGLSPDDLEHILRQHAEGCAGKYLEPDRLSEEIARVWVKVKPQGAAVEGNADWLRDWLRDCLLDQGGRPIPNIANVLLALGEDPELRDLVARDDMLALTILMRPVPKVGAPNVPRPLTDEDVTRIQEHLQRCGLPRINRDTVHQALEVRARERAFHPVQDYLDSLRWDGRPRLSRWLSTYLGAEDAPYTSTVGRMFPIAMVARIYQPGCKVDHMLVLEGPQGTQKSTTAAILGGAWFSDAMPEISASKDASAHLAGKWLIEIAEMHAVSRAEAAHLKAFITRKTERYRPAYGRLEVVQPRQCVFIATTNQAIYLKDTTGGRRFWPVKVGKIDTDALVRDRDQLFAEAVVAFRAGESWWPDQSFEHEHIAPEQEARQEDDPWTEKIREFFRTTESATVGEVAVGALHFETRKISTTDQRRITSILEAIGCKRSEKKDGRGYHPWSRP